MYKVLVVEDEILEREGISKIISQMELDVVVVGEASSGKRALEMIQRIKPDIVVTDIRMPGLSGIELAAEIKNRFPDTKIIFITGYQDFEYAKSAISLGAYGYVLKPVDVQELFTVIKKAVDELKHERHIREERRTLEQQVELSLPLLQQEFLRSLLLGSINLNDEVLTHIKKSRISFDASKSYRVAVINLDNYYVYEKESSTEQKLRLTQSILYDLNDMAGGNLCSIVVQMDKNLFACLIPWPESYTQQEIESLFARVIKRLGVEYGITATIGISQNTSKCGQLSRLYREALTATLHKWYMGPGKVIWSAELPCACRDNSDISIEQEVGLKYIDLQASITKFILSGDDEGINKFLVKFFDKLPVRVKNTRKHVQGLCLQIMEIGERLLGEMGECLSVVFGDRMAVLEELLLLETFEDVKLWIIYKMRELTLFINRKSTDRNSRIVKKIIDIINERYFEDLSMEMFAQEVYLSPNYIRKIFKDETGQTILEYITQVRMKKAAEMMKDPSLKVADISRNVGYESVSYFGQLFKQYFGVTPKEYMESVENL